MLKISINKLNLGLLALSQGVGKKLKYDISVATASGLFLLGSTLLVSLGWVTATHDVWVLSGLLDEKIDVVASVGKFIGGLMSWYFSVIFFKNAKDFQ